MYYCKMRRRLLVIGTLLLSCAVWSQNTIGIPTIINHPRQEYRAGSQNWDVKQDANGIIYFANNDGLLSYDGTFWRLYPLPNKVIARSLAIAGDGKIYVGGQEEFGYFSPGANGELAYTSLKSLIPDKNNDFADVWDICLLSKDVFFRSNKLIFRLSGHSLSVYKSTNWVFLGSTGKEVIACEFNKGMVRFNGSGWEPMVHQGALPAEAKVSAVLPFGSDSLLISTFYSGLFILHHDTLSAFSSPAINAITQESIAGAGFLSADRLAVITNLAGCIVINKKGELVQQIVKQQGLQNNNILCMLLDRDRNLWLGLDHGIDMISYNNAITTISPEKEDRNAGYTSYIYHNRLYLGMATGVYSAQLDNSSNDLSLVKSRFDFVENTRGQAWNLCEVNGKLLLAHNNGAFLVQGNTATSIDNKTGFWTFLPLYTSAVSPVMIAGTYNGINVYNDAPGGFSNPKVHAQFESAKFIAIDGRTIWIAHSYKGMYKVVLNENDEPLASVYHDTRGMLSANHNHLFKIKDKIILTTDNGTFEYDHRSGDFIRSAWYEEVFGHVPVTYLKDDRYGNTWFCRDKRVGVIDMVTGKPRTTWFPELDNKITSGGYENINVIDSNNVIIAGEKGFFHINYAQYLKTKYPIRVLIRAVRSTAQKNLLLYGGYNTGTPGHGAPAIPYQGNSLHFEFSSVLYGQEQNIDYSYYLEGFDKAWSDWGKRPEKDYTNIPAGHYVFRVKSRNSRENESPMATWSFTVLPPWYQTWWAQTVYSLLFIGLLYFFYKRQQRKYKRLQLVKLQEQQRRYDEEQQQLQVQHQLAMSKSEAEIVHLKNEKLQAEIEIIHLNNEKLQTEIEGKNRELASNAMSFVQKGELLSKIKEDLMRLKNTSEVEKDSKDFKKIIRIIDHELNNVHDWEQFAVHFDSVHTDYLKNLKERFPELTASDLKLCAYLRLNLSTKEISQLMNISIRGVETSRYRLRKKLELPNDANLVDYLLTWQPGGTGK
jgi:DNA-binding CsgD family transcriptional regulator